MTSGRDLTEEVLGRLEATPDPRLREIMQSLVRHLHAFAREVNLTEEEWHRGILFLTEVGRATTGTRQEFILLSDTLGLSSLVVDQTHGPGGDATEPTLLGPFHVHDAPHRELGDTIAIQDPGEPLLVRGSVRDVGGEPIPGAELDVWQASSNRLYDVQDMNQPRGNLRGRFTADEQGRFRFRTVRPVSYPIPDDGPVGRLLDATGRHPWRAAHIHFIVSAPGYRTLTTTVFDAENEYLDSDAVFGVKPSLVRQLTRADDGSTLLLEADFVLNR
jgi:protocatechuate 3,4-dioxygenase beta subunit